jgi:diguanylate cyclase (GGDEF)-like protein
MSLPIYRTMRTPQKWNRGILNLFWAMSTIILGSMLLIHYVLSPHVPFLTPVNYLFHGMLVPNAIFLLLVLALEIVYRRWPNGMELATVISSILTSHSYFYFIHDSYDTLPIILIFPLLISMMYFKKRYLIITLAMCLMAMAALYIQPGRYVREEDLVEIIIVGGILFCAAMTGLGVIHRSHALVEKLDQSMQSEQELLVQTIVMERMTKIDPLTGLHNHKSFHEYFAQLLEQYNRSPFPLQLAILDIDNFKQVNDTYGHWVGDIALKQVAACISKHITANAFAARYGGEEFVVLLCETSEAEAYASIERLRKTIALNPVAELNRRPVTVSVGLHAVAPGETKAYCFQQADHALYESKNNGKNRTTVQ